jgi:DNA-binding NtrC family response regulator
MAHLSPGRGEHAARVLLVDDETEYTASLAKVLGRRHIDVTVAADGEAALAAFTPGAFDVVLLDVKMPGGMDGLEVLAELRRRDPTLPVILITGHRAPRQENELAGQAFALLLKPYPISELCALIDRAAAHAEE